MSDRAALVRLAAHGLPGANREPVRIERPDDLLAAATAARALPWVAAAVDDGRVLDVDPAWRSELRRCHLDAVQTTMAAHAAVLEVARLAAAADISDFRILKGCATAHLDYGRVVDRFSSDVDVLVATGERPRLVARFPADVVPAPRRPRWQDRFGKSTTVISSAGVEVDIHIVLANGYFGMVVPVEELMATVDSFTIGPLHLRSLDGPNRLIHAACHVAASAHVGLHSIRDVPQLVLSSGVDWAEAIRRSERWRIDALVARGVVTAWDTFSLPHHEISDWARRVQPRGRQRLALAVAKGRPRGELLTGPIALPPRDWPAYVGPLLFPSQEYLAETRRRPTDRLVAMLRELARPGRSGAG